MFCREHAPSCRKLKNGGKFWLAAEGVRLQADRRVVPDMANDDEFCIKFKNRAFSASDGIQLPAFVINASHLTNAMPFTTFSVAFHHSVFATER
jgi:hypothetical protein